MTATSSTSAKVALFRRLVAGREDVLPLRWENRKTGRGGYALACGNEWKRGLCGKPRVKCGECAHQAFLPVTDEMIDRHLRGGASSRSDAGDFVAGVYPLLADESCRFLAADFDKASWSEDALAMMETCRLRGVPQRWNDPDRAMAAMSGSSLPMPCRHGPPAPWARHF